MSEAEISWKQAMRNIGSWAGQIIYPQTGVIKTSTCDYRYARDGSIRRVTPKRYSSKADRRNQIKARRLEREGNAI